MCVHVIIPHLPAVVDGHSMAVVVLGTILDVLNIQVVQCNPTPEQHVDFSLQVLFYEPHNMYIY